MIKCESHLPHPQRQSPALLFFSARYIKTFREMISPPDIRGRVPSSFIASNSSNGSSTFTQSLKLPVEEAARDVANELEELVSRLNTTVTATSEAFFALVMSIEERPRRTNRMLDRWKETLDVDAMARDIATLDAKLQFLRSLLQRKSREERKELISQAEIDARANEKMSTLPYEWLEALRSSSLGMLNSMSLHDACVALAAEKGSLQQKQAVIDISEAQDEEEATIWDAFYHSYTRDVKEQHDLIVKRHLRDKTIKALAKAAQRLRANIVPRV